MVMSRREIDRQCVRSEKEEVRIFFRKAREFYITASREGEELYDLAFERTREFRSIRGSTLIQSPRIIKILRYLLVPSISQMKLGQIVGMSSTAGVEDGSAITPNLSVKLARILRQNLDRSRFVWHQTRLNSRQRALAMVYAKRWTLSLLANQNAATNFRNWRKDLQENKIERAIMEASFRLLPNRPTIREVETISPGTFVKESKVGRRSPQKADFVLRARGGRGLIALEAKAVGVKIDAYKRIKEVRDKATAWSRLFGDRIETIAVIAGFIPSSEVESLSDSGIRFYWEHDLRGLTRYLQRT